MKELEKFNPDIVKEIFENKIVKKKLGTIGKPKGTIFEFDPTDEKLSLAVIELSDTFGVKPKLITKEDRIYVFALNETNAMKKINKGKFWFHTLDLVKKAK